MDILEAKLDTPANSALTTKRQELPVITKLLGDERFDKPFPLTDIQQAYWIGRQDGFDLGNISAHGYMEVNCRDLDIAHFEKIWNVLIQRHDMLRAVVDSFGEQRILSTVPWYSIQTTDLIDSTQEQQGEELGRVRDEMSHQVLDSEVWPLFDIRLSKIDDRITRLHLSLDVLIFDAHSFDIMSEEMRCLYTGTSADLLPLSLSYADYVNAMEEMKGTDSYKCSQEYWRNKIASLPPQPSLPLAKLPEDIKKPEFNRRCHRFDSETWTRLKQHSRRQGLTPSSVLLSVYGYVISRWSSNKKFTLNLTLFNRLPFHEEVNDLVGDFTSVVLLGMDYSTPRTFIDQVRHVQQELWQDMDHRFVSGVWVLRELNEAQRESIPVNMPVVFTSALQQDGSDNVPAAMSWLGSIDYTITQTPQVWLDHQITEDLGSLICDWDAVEDLFPEGCLDAMFKAYVTIIEALAQQDGLAWHCEDFDVLPQEQSQQIEAANCTAAPVPAGLLHSQIIENCLRHPDRTAVIEEAKELTYGELYQASNFLAHRFWMSGIETGELVAVLLPKGRQQVISVLGILEAGGAYVPIESSYPAERVVQLLSLAKVSAVVSTGEILARQSIPDGIKVFNLDDFSPHAHHCVPLPAMQSPTDIAYVIYTSGSTGTPKGVVIDHRGALNTIVDINNKLDLGECDRVLALSALNFDLSVFDIFGLLSVGGAIVIPEAERQHEPAVWMRLIADNKVTVWNTVPALMDIYVSYLQGIARQKDTNLRWVLMSGDWINLALPDAIRQCCPQAAPISLGGATEASIWSIWYPIKKVEAEWTSIPYGKPLTNQCFYVLDEHMRPCPQWVPGELYIGGVGLAKEYWQDRKKTADAFVTNPHTGERLYRTGDLGRYIEAGHLEFLGRKDFQVKINGFRVELGEVESNMLAVDGVRSAVAHVHGDAGQSKQLVGYYVPSVDKQDPAKLKFRLSQPGIRRLSADEGCICLPPARVPQNYYTERCSHRAFSSSPVSEVTLAKLLACIDQGNHEGRPKYRYGSAGALYPVQTYLHIKEGKVEGIEAGLYYYHPIERALYCLEKGECIGPELMYGINAVMAEQCAFQLFFVSNLEAIEPIYGQHSLEFSLLEAGLMTQLLEEQETATGLGMCQVGGFDFSPVAKFFQLDYRFAYLHSLVVGMALNDDERCIHEQSQSSSLADNSLEDRLRNSLKDRLPDYMVPSIFMPIEQLPLSANGKVDRKALPKPRNNKMTQKTDVQFRLPESKLAKRICDVWSEVLDMQAVGLGENIFDLGGTSVDMIKIHAWLQPELPKPVSLVDMFFTYPTIGALVEYLQEKTATQNASSDRRSKRTLSSQKNRRRASKTRRSGKE